MGAIYPAREEAAKNSGWVEFHEQKLGAWDYKWLLSTVRRDEC